MNALQGAKANRNGARQARGAGRSLSRSLRVVLLVALIAGVFAAERRAVGERAAYRLAEGWAPVPGATTLSRLSFGYERVVADLMWLKGLQYFGKQRLAGAPMPKIAEYIDVVVGLDPQFIAPYIFGGLVLAEDVGWSEAAIDLLQRGIAANPTRWELPFELGFILYVDLGQPRRAAKYFEMAAAREGAPRMARRFAAWAYAKGRDRTAARRVCEEIIRESENEAMRAFAMEALAKVQIEEDLEVLEMSIERFRVRTGRLPGSLGNLVEGGELEGIPVEPRGGFYAYRPQTGEVGSSSQIERMVNLHLKELEDSIARYRASWGEYPPGLESLVTAGLLSEVRTVFGLRYDYDPATGRVWPVDPWRT